MSRLGPGTGGESGAGSGGGGATGSGDMGMDASGMMWYSGGGGGGGGGGHGDVGGDALGDDDAMDEYDEGADKRGPRVPLSKVNTIMRKVLPEKAKIAKAAKLVLQECATEFIGFASSEASERCNREGRMLITAHDVLNSLASLGFSHYASVLESALRSFRAHRRRTGKGSRSPRSPSDSGRRRRRGRSEAQPPVRQSRRRRRPVHTGDTGALQGPADAGGSPSGSALGGDGGAVHPGALPLHAPVFGGEIGVDMWGDQGGDVGGISGVVGGDSSGDGITNGDDESARGTGGGSSGSVDSGGVGVSSPPPSTPGKRPRYASEHRAASQPHQAQAQQPLQPPPPPPPPPPQQPQPQQQQQPQPQPQPQSSPTNAATIPGPTLNMPLSGPQPAMYDESSAPTE